MKKCFTLLSLVLLHSAKSHGQSEEDITAYINTYKPFAIAEMQRTGIPASITLAQGIHETLAGTSDLVRRSNNHFGIKCKDTWTGSVVYHDDDARGECFRSYGSAADSYRDHSEFLAGSPRYASLFKLDPLDYEGWAYGLKRAGYATNIKYSQILIKLIKDYNLQQYTLIAMGKLADSQVSAVAHADREEKTASVKRKPPVDYPSGQFEINRTRVVFVKAGTSLLSVADDYHVGLRRLMDFNELDKEDILTQDQLIFLQRKRKVGANEIHVVETGETLYTICQEEGIRLQSLLDLNFLSNGNQPAAGEKLYLQNTAPSKPQLAVMNKPLPEPVAAQVVPTIASQGSAPQQITHVVQSKETLYSIARKYGVDVNDIRQWNKLETTDLKVGQELTIIKN
jgi:LysM repeat protein